ncbi:MAG: BlaI/MecI/CopY family transcriptional regulator [Litorimonas sp.]
MRKMKKPSAAETAILTILWENQPCSVKTVHAHLKDERGVGYTTVLKQVQRMLDKGLVSRQQGQGRSFLYSATETEDATKSDLYERFVQNAFGGSASELVMHALGNLTTSEAEINAIKDFIAKLEK